MTVRLGATPRRRPGRRVLRHRHGHHLPRLPGGLRGGPRRRRRTRRDGDDDERRLPQLREGDAARPVLDLQPDGPRHHAAGALHRATLVQALEERGIGRPSTYASIIGTIIDRGYVFKRGTALVPSLAGVRRRSALLEQHFGRAGRLRLHRRDGGGPRPDRRRRAEPGRTGCAASTSASRAGRRPGAARRWCPSLGDIDAREVNSIPIGDDIVLRVGRYGPYVQRGPDGDGVVAARVGARGHGARRADAGEGRGAAGRAER